MVGIHLFHAVAIGIVKHRLVHKFIQARGIAVEDIGNPELQCRKITSTGVTRRIIVCDFVISRHVIQVIAIPYASNQIGDLVPVETGERLRIDRTAGSTHGISAIVRTYLCQIRILAQIQTKQRIPGTLQSHQKRDTAEVQRCQLVAFTIQVLQFRETAKFQMRKLVVCTK